jgi:hypothetical protein
MISEELARFLESNVSILLGTRDGENRPACARLMGARVSADRTKVTVLLPRPTGERSLANIADNGLVAVTFCRVFDNNAVQLKGRTAPPREPTPEEIALAGPYRERFADALAEVGMARPLSIRLTNAPAVALEVHVEQIFQQTPGPSAGHKLA